MNVETQRIAAANEASSIRSIISRLRNRLRMSKLAEPM